MAKRVIVLLGDPEYNEDGVAGEVIKPGHLVKGVSTILKHATAAGAAARRFALEREEMGAGIDDTNQGTSTISSDYAVGDTVKVAAFDAGDRVLAWVASGVSVVEDDFLESAGDGTLRKYTNGVILGRALEDLTATSSTHLRVEVM